MVWTFFLVDVVGETLTVVVVIIGAAVVNLVESKSPIILAVVRVVLIFRFVVELAGFGRFFLVDLFFCVVVGSEVVAVSFNA